MDEPLVSSTRLRALRSALGGGDKPLLLTIHDYPDPDAIASALALQTLAGSWGVGAVIAHGGGIGREDNAEMVRLLKIDLKLFPSIPDFSEYRGAVFLDTQPMAKNQSLPPEVPVLAVLDHHRLSDDSTRLPTSARRNTSVMEYNDIRLTVGSSSTLALGYLETAGIAPDRRLATALFLGIKTDTDGLLRDAGPWDVAAYTKLLPLSDLTLAARISHPPLRREYFRFLHLAIERSLVFGSALMSFCGEVDSPDTLSTVSDLLIAAKGVQYALAAGVYNRRCYFSLRAKPPREDATRVLLHVVGPDGKGGGHNLSAGGFMDLQGGIDATLAGVRRRLVEATAATDGPGEKLI